MRIPMPEHGPIAEWRRTYKGAGSCIHGEPSCDPLNAQPGCQHRFNHYLPAEKDLQLAGQPVGPILKDIHTGQLWGTPVPKLHEWNAPKGEWIMVDPPGKWTPHHEEWNKGRQIITCKPGASMEQHQRWNQLCLGWEASTRDDAYHAERSKKSSLKAVAVPVPGQGGRTENGLTSNNFEEDSAFLWSIVEDNSRWRIDQAWGLTASPTRGLWAGMLPH